MLSGEPHQSVPDIGRSKKGGSTDADGDEDVERETPLDKICTTPA
jgi:hypothetical protein